MTDGEAIATYREALVRSVAAQTGLRGEALYRRVADLTQHGVALTGSRRMKPAAFRRHLNVLNDAFRTLDGVSACKPSLTSHSDSPRCASSSTASSSARSA